VRILRFAVALALLVALSACGLTVAEPVASPPASSAAVPSSTPGAVTATPRPAPPGPERVVSSTVATRAAQPMLAPRFETRLIADYCVDRDVPAPSTGDPTLTLLDRTYALGPDAVPSDLVAASAAGLSGASGTKLVRAALVDDLAAMRAAWEAAGLTVLIESAYRSYGAQASTFDSWVARLGYAAALERSARPGHSEHQLGTAFDFTSPGWAGRFGDWAVESAEGAWLAAHAWEYGFVMSYPLGSQPTTCFSYEPWHYRWIGREAAAAWHASRLTLREYLATRVTP
jgi:D-alanyl-D-alanine carboxypeptidase